MGGSSTHGAEQPAVGRGACLGALRGGQAASRRDGERAGAAPPTAV